MAHDHLSSIDDDFQQQEENPTCFTWNVNGPQYGNRVITVIVKDPEPLNLRQFMDDPIYVDGTKPPSLMTFSYESKMIMASGKPTKFTILRIRLT